VNESDIKPGHIDNDTGNVNVVVWYSAILFRPFINEVVDAVVTNCSDAVGFHCKVGPMYIYVNRYGMPEDIAWDPIRQDCFMSQDEEIEIREGSVVRLRIMGLTLEAADISAVGTIKDDYLGLLTA
jgi:DNA-directed RNA polymerase II subunit RPB7